MLCLLRIHMCSLFVIFNEDSKCLVKSTSITINLVIYLHIISFFLCIFSILTLREFSRHNVIFTKSFIACSVVKDVWSISCGSGNLVILTIQYFVMYEKIFYIVYRLNLPTSKNEPYLYNEKTFFQRNTIFFLT